MPALKLLLKMLGAIIGVMAVIVALSFVTHNNNFTSIGALIPLGLCILIIWKFGKEGIAASIYFLGVLFAAGGAVAVGAVLIVAATILSNRWNVLLFRKKA